MGFQHFYYHHEPVLLKESIENLITDKNGIYVDATFGGGGHSYAILKKLNKRGILIALDQDKESIKRNFIKDKRFHLFHNNFIHIRDILNQNHIEKVSGILVDLGLSSLQIDNPTRGFSNQWNCTLDMRMNQESSYSAQNVINECSKKELFHIFYEYGEFKNAKKIVEKILKKRFQKNITNTLDLSNLFFIHGSFKKRKRFLARLFQSIRIEVNNEINILKDFLLESSKIILPGGRIAVISYHSIEDRITKYFLKEEFLIKKMNFKTLPFRMIHKKVIKPSFQEIIRNPRSRSARLRIAEKV
ncbi:S-adenosyl-methyltransferase MraW [Blattabacterium sp. (Blattella germanica) str. Bge]|uniref:16S rRNA (cytosine(1402)-N(4))-methyltransferase RsmH n=1 Tax=Blattabacterium sp. (Blattella germanica) TaxID=624186 RepID=UPI0001BB61C8|nr:16S rRNA (cytosine(1402)-N(4))-methyltransferase RsmH [Blattabacterium sp. (Blattella germanica)]ACY40402.1 S-adenosyl-methyltransferase MraW [Blattabacterium sp. (Blattella germanica) str. Bge]